MKATKYILFCLFFPLAAFKMNAETFRVSTSHIINISAGNTETQTAELSYSEVLAVFVEKENIFLQGVEFEIKQSDVNIEFPNSSIYKFYKNPNPKPEKNKKKYTAEEITQSILPARRSVSFIIPAEEKHSIAPVPNSVILDHIIKENSGAVMLRIFPAMKGLPHEIEKSKFTVNVKPVFSGKGGIKFVFNCPDKLKPVNVKVNNLYITDFSAPIPVQSGLNQVEVSSAHYRTEIRSCTVQPGRIETVTVNLKPIIPLLFINAPEGVIVSLDNKEIGSSAEKPLKIGKGKHTIKFKIGSYEIVRNFEAEDGKVYTIDMMLEVKITEE